MDSLDQVFQDTPTPQKKPQNQTKQSKTTKKTQT